MVSTLGLIFFRDAAVPGMTKDMTSNQSSSH